MPGTGNAEGQTQRVPWDKLAEMNAKARGLGVLTYVCEGGRAIADTMAVRTSQKLQRFCMITDSTTPKVRALEKCNKCTLYVGNLLTAAHAVCFARVRVVRQGEDPELFRELWTDHCKYWLSGPEDPKMCVLVLEIDESWMRAEYPGCSNCQKPCGCPCAANCECPNTADHPCGGDASCPCRAEYEKARAAWHK